MLTMIFETTLVQIMMMIRSIDEKQVEFPTEKQRYSD
jgi:hypothetical protein